MKIQKVKLSDIYPYFNNPRDNARAVEPVMESLKKFGFVKPIMVDKNMIIICGHTRYVAAFQAGCEYVPIIVSDMPEEQAKRFRILDNKIAEKSSFDENELIEELKKLDAPKDMQAFFFEDIDVMLNFSFDSFNQQAEESGGFATMQDYDNAGNPSDEYQEQLNEYNENNAQEEEAEEEEHEEPLFRPYMNDEGVKCMKVVCPYCGNIEEIQLD